MEDRVGADVVIALVINELGLSNVSRDLDSFYQWAFFAEMKIGSFGKSFIRKECTLDVEEYRAKLPIDFYQLVAVKTGQEYPEFNGNDFRFFHNSSAYLSDKGQSQSRMRSNTKDTIYGSNYKFSINSNYIDINLQTGRIGIVYYAIPMNDSGVFTISKGHEDAVSKYIQYMHIRKKYLNDKASRSAYMDLKEEWERACAQAYVNDDFPSLQEMDYAGMILNNHFPSFNRNIL